jgi:(2Fe-2S) ferredoxin
LGTLATLSINPEKIISMVHSLNKSDGVNSVEPKSQVSYYRKHIFFCLNQRENGETCCASPSAQAAFEHCKARIKSENLNGVGKVRVNKAGCLDRCAGGPVAVVYPEGRWYTYVDKTDIDEIIETDLIADGVVQRLLIPESVGH